MYGQNEEGKNHNNGVFSNCFGNVRFMLILVAAILCLTIVILWGAYGYPPGMRDFATYVLFTHTGPAYTVVLWGFVISYLIAEEPPPKLQFIYTAPGCILFAIVGILQIINLDDFSGRRVLVLFVLHVTVALFLVAILYLALRRYLASNEDEQSPYVVRVSRGGVPQYKTTSKK